MILCTKQCAHDKNASLKTWQSGNDFIKTRQDDVKSLILYARVAKKIRFHLSQARTRMYLNNKKVVYCKVAWSQPVRLLIKNPELLNQTELSKLLSLRKISNIKIRAETRY